jgi:peroxiredoxin Q/BCP
MEPASMTVLPAGETAPDFSLPTDGGDVFTLSSHRGRPVAIYFYPQDMTEGCTIENREFSALLPQFEAEGAVVVGISPDSIDSHCRFRDRFSLGAPLLSDPDHAVIEAYGCWALKKLYGREYMGVVRTSFVVGADGRIAAVLPAPRIKGHAAKVLEAVRALPD